jgi:hypothetical protein
MHRILADFAAYCDDELNLDSENNKYKIFDPACFVFTTFLVKIPIITWDENNTF